MASMPTPVRFGTPGSVTSYETGSTNEAAAASSFRSRSESPSSSTMVSPERQAGEEPLEYAMLDFASVMPPDLANRIAREMKNKERQISRLRAANQRLRRRASAAAMSSSHSPDPATNGLPTTDPSSDVDIQQCPQTASGVAMTIFIPHCFENGESNGEKASWATASVGSAALCSLPTPCRALKRESQKTFHQRQCGPSAAVPFGGATAERNVDTTEVQPLLPSPGGWCGANCRASARRMSEWFHWVWGL